MALKEGSRLSRRWERQQEKSRLPLLDLNVKLCNYLTFPQTTFNMHTSDALARDCVILSQLAEVLCWKTYKIL